MYRLCVCQRRLIKKLIDWLIDRSEQDYKSLLITESLPILARLHVPVSTDPYGTTVIFILILASLYWSPRDYGDLHHLSKSLLIPEIPIESHLIQPSLYWSLRDNGDLHRSHQFSTDPSKTTSLIDLNKSLLISTVLQWSSSIPASLYRS